MAAAFTQGAAYAEAVSTPFRPPAASSAVPSLVLAAIADQATYVPVAVSGTIADSGGTTWTLHCTRPDGTDGAAELSATSGAITGGAASPSATLTPTQDGVYILWLSDDDSNVGSSEVAVIGQGRWVLEDLSTWTLDDPNTLIASSTLGTTSTITSATGIQGDCDAGRDAVWLAKTLLPGVDYSTIRGVLIRVSGTQLGGTGTGAISRTRAGLVTAEAQASAAGNLAGLEVQSGGTRYPSTIAVGGAIGTTSIDVGAALDFTVWCPVDSSGPIGSTEIVQGASAVAARGGPGANASADLIACLALGNSASFASAASWTGLQVRTRVVYA